MRPTSVTVSSTAASAWIPVDWRAIEFNLGIHIDVSPGASLTWVVETTGDDIYDTSVTPVAIAAPAPLDTGTTDEQGQLTIRCRAVRLNVTWVSGSAKMTIISG